MSNFFLKYGFWIFGFVMFVNLIFYMEFVHKSITPIKTAPNKTELTPTIPLKIEYVDSTVCPHCGNFVPINTEIYRLINVKKNKSL